MKNKNRQSSSFVAMETYNSVVYLLKCFHGNIQFSSFTYWSIAVETYNSVGLLSGVLPWKHTIQ